MIMSRKKVKMDAPRQLNDAEMKEIVSVMATSVEWGSLLGIFEIVEDGRHNFVEWHGAVFWVTLGCLAERKNVTLIKLIAVQIYP